MSNTVYLRMKGERQGEISSGCGTEKSIGNRYQYQHRDEILVYQLASSMTSTAYGMNHPGLRFTKPIDKSTPLLTTAINENEKLQLIFDFYRTNRYGRQEKYYQIELRGASIQGIMYSINPDVLDSENITVSYEYIRSKHLGANTEYSDLILPDNYKQLFPPNEKPQPEIRHIILTLGVFFDGTGNNAVNTQNMLAACTAAHFELSDPDAEIILARTAEEKMGISGTSATSYIGGYTNIHWLNTLYKTDIPIDTGQVQAAIYVEGIGTEAGKPDSMLGLTLGVADTGVIAKTDLAVKQIAVAIEETLRKLRQTISGGGMTVTSCQFDIFGFSRGAAAARHFANRIQDKDRVIANAIRYGMGEVNYVGAPAGKTRFIGIFDTVAAIGTPQNGLNPHTANTGEVNIMLRPGVAEKVFHITAQNECRFNFALNSVQPAWPELALPGAHSDIGGGYLPVVRENIFLTRPEGETVPLNTPPQKSRAYRHAVAQLSVLEASAVVAPLIRTNDISADVWEDERMPAHHIEGMQKRAFAALTMKQRLVKNDWSKVVLRVMLDAAQEAGVVFENIPDDNDDLSLTSELLELSGKTIMMGKRTRAGITPPLFNQQEIDLIAQDYIHCSANWNSITLDSHRKIYGGMSPSQIIGFVNRPDEGWKRTTYDMDGNKK
ncbi:type VI secretion system tube protein Hcp [Lelliottia sp. F153]|uniref:type VI secretion system tube protein TssD n=1 Tax=unclassified Lelliottia TaxID=2642424 RepID=UPI000C7EE74F|nr:MULTISPECIES: type VI secretion system tube protein TssD [unclassified Lelliottia]PLY44701.1 type VI secretion system tube protein Hcp [Lelliottia sp. F159]PLY49719.1 type VI secretion system tube protein Hcp [Lelliottia sp. F154]PLY54035.1 type VI secretion system tube protein Hcp [Lelliottia sp. F153]